MSAITLYIEAIGLCGPGLPDWAQSQSILSGSAAYTLTPAVVNAPSLLPPAERRRVGTIVKLAMATAMDALSTSAYTGDQLQTVFTSSGGDGDNCHVICEALASQDRLISPTRFTNSVHNAPSGYWGIAAQARPASTSLCAFDASFGAGFLEACTQALSSQEPVLLVAYDTPYPEPLKATRPIVHSFGVALVLCPNRTEKTLATIQVHLGEYSVTALPNTELESVRSNVPAARSLPLLTAVATIAQKGSQRVVLELFDNQQLAIEVSA
jgi:Beta-ketoacyl synthase, N-terminal domain